jgi:signal transduction histidine kinase
MAEGLQRRGRRPTEGTPRGGVTLPPEELRRLRRLITANLIGMAGAVVSLPVLGFTIAPSRRLWVDVALLALGSAMLAGGLVLLRRDRSWVAVLLLLLANWIVAIGGTFETPFLEPVALLAVLLPLMVTFGFLPSRLIRPVTVGAVVAATTVAVIAEFPENRDDQPGRWLAVILLLVFVPVVAGLIALGVAQSYHRVLEQAELLRDSRARVVVAADDARRRLERDLHDGAQQRLVTTSVRLALARRLLATDPVRADQALADAVAELHDALRDLRELAHGIYPPLLAERGLGPALAAATRRLAVPVDLRVAVAGRYPADVEAAVYFCCLEALQNAVKHAAASRITLTVDAGPPLVFTVEDDGRGYDPAAVPPGTGVANMADRVAAVGGRFGVRARPGAGAVVRGEIPLPAAS